MVGLLTYYQFLKMKRKWGKNNQHNSTVPGCLFDAANVKVGRASYGYINVINHNPNCFVSIGNYCSIAPEVYFIPGSDHRLDTISTFPFRVRFFADKSEGLSKGSIIVEDDVWIGFRSTILSGVTIKQGAVIAAGSVVTKDVPAYAIVGGSPARVLKYRFSEETIQKLLSIDYSQITKDVITDNKEIFLTAAEECKLDEFLSHLPKKQR